MRRILQLTARTLTTWALLAVVLCLVEAGCGTPSADNADGSIIPLGPSSTADGSDSSGTDDGGDGDTNGPAQNDNTQAPPAGNDNAGDDGGTANDNADDGFPGSPPFADACEAVNNRSFGIAGLSLDFTGSIFSWITSGGQVVGNFTCDGFDLLGIPAEPVDGQEEFVGRYDPVTDTVTWQGTIYLPEL